MKAFVCLVVIAILAVVLWPEPKTAEPAPVAVAERIPPPAPAPAPTIAKATPLPRPKPIVSRDDLVILHGQVVNRVPAGLLVSSTAVEHGGAAALGDRSEYGPLLVSVGGQWQPANWTPDDRADGLVLLAGDLPQGVISRESTLNIIVAKWGKNTFTTEYEAAPARPAGWMWKNRGNPLDPPVK